MLRFPENPLNLTRRSRKRFSANMNVSHPAYGEMFGYRRREKSVKQAKNLSRERIFLAHFN